MKWIETSPEVWAVIRVRHHKKLTVFATRSHPCGDPYGNPSQGVMETSYGFENADFELIRAETTWTINPEKAHEREDERHRYWLAMPEREED